MSLPFPPNSPIDAVEFFGSIDSRGDKEFSRKKQNISYASDGRKMEDGILVKEHEPEQLWKELFIRQLLGRCIINDRYFLTFF